MTSPTTLMTTLESSVGVSRKTIIGVGVGCTAFIGYCVYFDRKRRSHPDFKRKLREKRQSARVNPGGRPRPGAAGPPEFADITEMQAFFMQELQLGEELMVEGDTEGALDHFVRAVQMAGMTPQLVQIFQQTLPPAVFSQLVDRLRQAQMDAPQGPIRHAPGAGDMGQVGNIEIEDDQLE